MYLDNWIEQPCEMRVAGNQPKRETPVLTKAKCLGWTKSMYGAEDIIPAKMEKVKGVSGNQVRKADRGCKSRIQCTLKTE